MLALDLARNEAGLLLIEVDYISAHHALIDAQTSTPFELSLGWTVALDKERFNGQDALRREHARGPAWRFVGHRGGLGLARAALRRRGPPAQASDHRLARECPAVRRRPAGGVRDERVLVAAAQALHRAGPPGSALRRARDGRGDRSHRRAPSPARRRDGPSACRSSTPSASEPEMAQTWDAIIIGGGHNGLVTAAYLARAGRKVLVLERRYRVGGAAVSEEIYPGFKFSVFSYVVSLLRPEIIRDLDLPRHGLEILPLESTVTPMDNGDYLAAWGDPDKTRREIYRHSPRDAEAMVEFGRLMHHMAQAVKPILSMIPPDPTSLSPRDLLGLLELGTPFPEPGPRALPRALQAHDDELGRLSGRVVRDRRAQGDEVGERDHRHVPRTALAGDRVRPAASLHGGDRRLVPGLGLRQRRHGGHQRGDRRRRPSLRRRDPHRRARHAGPPEARPRHRCGARERRGAARPDRRVESRPAPHVPAPRGGIGAPR